MKPKWFKRWGWFYRPATVPGFVIVAAALLFCANVFWAMDRKSHSVSDTLYGVYPFFAATFLLVDWLARKTSEDSNSATSGEAGGSKSCPL